MTDLSMSMFVSKDDLMEERMKQYEFHPWEIWNGGECPCPDDMVQVQLACDTRGDAENNPVVKTSGYRWNHTGGSGDIIAFRRVKKPEVHTLFGAGAYDGAGKWVFSTDQWPRDTHKLTFSVDSEGNPYNFNCERIK